MIHGILKTARDVARRTPETRNRAADFYRTLAIAFVVLGHWTLVAPYVPANSIELRNILSEQPWTQYLTWLFQVMPVFFFVGGFSNAASWSSARSDLRKRRVWAGRRMRRLLVPVVPLIALWAIAAVIAYSIGVDPDLAKGASKAALIPVWFLAVYVMVTLVVPISYRIWEKVGFFSVAALAGLAVLVDLVGVGLGQGWLRWANYGPVWLAVHQLGYWWWRGVGSRAGPAVLLCIGAAWMWFLMGPAGYPLSMVSVPGEEFSNTRPPTTAMLALGSVQIGILLVLAKPVNAFLRRDNAWTLVVVAARNIMTIYLWHLTVVILVAGLSLVIGGVGLGVEPGTARWWALRPVWIAVLLACLLPFLAILGGLESGSRSGPSGDIGIWRAVPGAVLSCAGLALLALNGMSAERFPGFAWFAVLLSLGGIVLATTRSFRR